MHIERIQVEEGFLDGIDLELSPGLNVVIGARGTGKTSLIELIRFCLDIPGYTNESAKRSRDHALSVLGSGQITLTLADGLDTITVTRSAADRVPRASGPFVSPIILSQTEIETLALQPNGRLQLLDSFLINRRHIEPAASEAVALVRSLTLEAEGLRKELDEFGKMVDELPRVELELAELADAEGRLSSVSSEAADKKKSLDELSAQISTLSVAAAAVERTAAMVTRWRSNLMVSVSTTPQPENWPSLAGGDPLGPVYEALAAARASMTNAAEQAIRAEAVISATSKTLSAQRLVAEENARSLRQEIELLHAGAGNVSRQGQLLRERKAQLSATRDILGRRASHLEKLIEQRDASLDELDRLSVARYAARTEIASSLNARLGPKIRVTVHQAGQTESFAAKISEVLRGSGMRYNELATSLAANMSPRELLEAIEGNDFELVSDVADISRDRAARTLSHLREGDIGSLATVAVDDLVTFQLLDGSEYKDISQLSMGQRCTVVLPIVLCHSERILIVDQPEDHIDNAFIVDTLIRAIIARDPNGQLIFSTHNANIPVLGEANRVLQLGSDGRRAFVLQVGALDSLGVVGAITTVMEGGAQAFDIRASFYSKSKVKPKKV